MRLLITLCATALLLAACGIKGPLTLPPKQPSKAAADHNKAAADLAVSGTPRFIATRQS